MIRLTNSVENCNMNSEHPYTEHLDYVKDRIANSPLALLELERQKNAPNETGYPEGTPGGEHR